MDNLLKADEKILFQIREGMCSLACAYCYERFKEKAEMPLEVIKSNFNNLKKLGIKEAELIGSEPTEYSRWQELLLAATKHGIKLIVYTGGLHMERLISQAVKAIILHLVFKPGANFMAITNQLLNQNKKIYLRVNFNSEQLSEKNMIFEFLDKVKPEYRKQVALKYSFTSRTEDKSLRFFDVQALKEAKKNFFTFCKQFHRRYPEVEMYSERPLYKCCFSEAELKQYSYAGIDFRCHMEYTVYKDGKIALCPPVEKLIAKRPLSTPESLAKAVKSIKAENEQIIRLPSFPECADCLNRQDGSCQGGCLSNKL